MVWEGRGSMSLEGILLGLIALAIGAAFCFYGFRFFLILLPLWAFLVGFAAGAQLISVWFGEGFLATVTGWVVGFVIGAGFALISYLWYWAAVVLLSGGVGYLIGVGVMGLINVTGFLAVAVGLVVAVIFAIAAIVLAVPRVLVVVLTAMGGAAMLIGGVLLALGVIPVAGLTDGVLGAVIKNNIFWGIVYIALAVAGAFYQLRMQVLGELDRAAYRYA